MERTDVLRTLVKPSLKTNFTEKVDEPPEDIVKHRLTRSLDAVWDKIIETVKERYISTEEFEGKKITIAAHGELKVTITAELKLRVFKFLRDICLKKPYTRRQNDNHVKITDAFVLLFCYMAKESEGNLKKKIKFDSPIFLYSIGTGEEKKYQHSCLFCPCMRMDEAGNLDEAVDKAKTHYKYFHQDANLYAGTFMNETTLAKGLTLSSVQFLKTVQQVITKSDEIRCMFDIKDNEYHE